MVHAEGTRCLTNCLRRSTRVDDGGAQAVLDSTGLGAGGLEGLDDVQGVLVSDLAEDDVAAVEPRGNDGGDEELGAVARGGLNISMEQARGGWGRCCGLTCWGQRWPWRADQAWCASAGSSRRQISHRRWTCHQCPESTVSQLLGTAPKGGKSASQQGYVRCHG
jgi:hypothetical protein